jgi:hypothetical protein
MELAKLEDWKYTKRTGRASVKVLWQGWFKLQTILEGYELAKYIGADLCSRDTPQFVLIPII